MQVAQVLQVLAISSWEEVDSKATDLYHRFPKVCQLIVSVHDYILSMYIYIYTVVISVYQYVDI